MVYGSDFCNDNGCSFSRGSGTSIGATVCFIIAGMGFFLSSDYPGEDGNGEEPQDMTNAVVYHEDPELTSTEYAKAKRISAMLGGSDEPSGEVGVEAAAGSRERPVPVVPVVEVGTTAASNDDDDDEQPKPFAAPY